VATLATRSPKVPPTGGAAEGLRARWRAKATELGVGEKTIASLLGRHVREPVPDDVRRSVVDRLVGTAGLTATESAFERRDAVRAVAELLRDGATGAEVEAIAELVLEGDGVVALPSVGRGGERRHTTEALLAVERQAVEGAAGRRDAGVAVVAQPLVDGALAEAPHLADEQQAMVRRLTTSGAGVDVVVGKAGSGKTAALAAARAAWEGAGHQVVGTALSARAAKELHEGAGVESVTIAALLRRMERGNNVILAGGVLVVDEAGMVGTRTIARLLSEAERAGAKVVLVGDDRQLPEIEAGGVFGALARRLGAISLTESRRQHERWERHALDELRHGDVRRALDAFGDAGRVVTAPDMAAARRALVERWHQAVDGQRSSRSTITRIRGGLTGSALRGWWG
jgi:ATP-dependent exoDNAse (exonuclease V) alpha subunit